MEYGDTPICWNTSSRIIVFIISYRYECNMLYNHNACEEDLDIIDKINPLFVVGVVGVISFYSCSPCSSSAEARVADTSSSCDGFDLVTDIVATS
jgi:hypothetical protein